MTTDGVAERAAELTRLRVPFVHARVVLAQRPTSAKPGDEALVLPDGSMAGFVGGDCAEATVRARALALLDSGESLLLRITPEPEEATDGTLTVHNPCLSGGTLEIFLEPRRPAPMVVVSGDTPIARALMTIGAALGYELVRFTESLPADAAAVVVASHGRDETELLGAAVAAEVAYIGLVASPKRGTAVLAALDLVGDRRIAAINTPAGLDIGARTPEEIALSILADIVARRPRPSGRAVGPALDVDQMQARDPVCNMGVAVVESSLHLDHEGARFYFCGSGCLRAFAADPAAFPAAVEAGHGAPAASP